MTAGIPVLEARSISKAYGHVQALDSASLAIHAGEVVGLVGDNGAGKSTLLKTIAGSVLADDGEILIDGAHASINNPGAAQQAGIQTVYQDLALAPDLDVVANLFLGREPVASGLGRRLGVMRRRAARQQAGELLASMNIRLPSLEVPVSVLSGGQRQIIAVARALNWANRVVLMDEPTAALGVTQTALVNRLVRDVSGRGMAVVVISHNLPELLQLVDRVVVLRLGAVVANVPAAELTTTSLLAAMTGLQPDPTVTAG